MPMHVLFPLPSSRCDMVWYLRNLLFLAMLQANLCRLGALQLSSQAQVEQKGPMVSSGTLP